MLDIEWIWVDQTDQLEQLCQKWMQLPAIAIDTEFVRVTTFYPQVGLIQIFDGENCYLIDPLEILNWDRFKELMSHDKTTKIFHACKEDLEVFRRLLGEIPKPIFDTQIGAAMAGMGGIMGLGRLIKAVKHFDLPKDQTRSDWLQRPLTDRQLRYAALDVVYLIEITDHITQLLKQQDRWHWFQEEMMTLLQQSLEVVSSDELYKDVKLAWKLKPKDLMILKSIVSWRDKIAREKDRPRSHVIPDRSLSWIAMRKPRTIEQLKRVDGMKPQLVERFGRVILDLVGQATSKPESMWPERLPKPMNPQMGEWFKSLKKVVSEFGEARNIPAEIILRKQPLKELLESGYPRGPFTVPESMKGWREKELVPKLMAHLELLRQGKNP